MPVHSSNCGREASVPSSPLADIAFPLLALTHGLQVGERLHQHFGDVETGDLWLPFFCLSTNLTTGDTDIDGIHHARPTRQRLHDAGLVFHLVQFASPAPT